MRPTLAGFNATNLGLPDMVSLRYFGLRPWVVLDGSRLFFGKLGSSASLTSIRGAVFNAVHLIRRCRVPSQVAKVVVRCVAVVMASLASFRARTSKSGQDNSVNLKQLVRIVLPKQQIKSVVSLIMRRLFEATIAHVTDASTVRDIVKPFIPDYWHPVFHVNTITPRGIKVNGT